MVESGFIRTPGCRVKRSCRIHANDIHLVSRTERLNSHADTRRPCNRQQTRVMTLQFAVSQGHQHWDGSHQYHAVGGHRYDHEDVGPRRGWPGKIGADLHWSTVARHPQPSFSAQTAPTARITSEAAWIRFRVSRNTSASCLALPHRLT